MVYVCMPISRTHIMLLFPPIRLLHILLPQLHLYPLFPLHPFWSMSQNNPDFTLESATSATSRNEVCDWFSRYVENPLSHFSLQILDAQFKQSDAAVQHCTNERDWFSWYVKNPPSHFSLQILDARFEQSDTA